MKADAQSWGEAVHAAVRRERALDLDRARECIAAALERDEEAVPGVVDLLAAVAGEEVAQRLIMPPQQVRPRVIADRFDMPASAFRSANIATFA
ncbi:MAG TPA: hypothetical protein VGR11_01825 [Solirubrobacteraceae bacterium]|nr:hypothetical protein [Solirubrobacteraceae bacterium]